MKKTINKSKTRMCISGCCTLSVIILCSSKMLKMLSNTLNLRLKRTLSWLTTTHLKVKLCKLLEIELLQQPYLNKQGLWTLQTELLMRFRLAIRLSLEKCSRERTQWQFSLRTVVTKPQCTIISVCGLNKFVVCGITEAATTN